MIEPEPLALLLSDDVQTFLTYRSRRVYLTRGRESESILEKTWKNATFVYDAHMKKQYIIGVDEAGRWPWAGPVVAWSWMADFSVASGLLDSLDGLDDSKSLTEQKREKLFAEIERMQHRNECQYAFSYRDADIIDSIGIREANRQCMQDVLLSLLQFTDEQDSMEIFIDGCDNYQFDIWEFEYLFARKKRKEKQELSIPVIARDDSQYTPCGWAIQAPENWHSGSPRFARDDGIMNRSIHYLIHGDALIPAISAASIIAKVTRDRMMCDFHEDFPEYGFDTHKGYGTRKHHDALLHYGITYLHRKSYAPVKALISTPSSL
jgi:ribonuclease HII